MTLLLLILYWQAAEKPDAPPPPPPGPEVLQRAKVAFRAGNYTEAVQILEPTVAAGQVLGILLSADAHFAMGTVDALDRAVFLYERALYEDDESPFRDHCYHQLAQIHLRKATMAEQYGKDEDAQLWRDEAAFNLRQLAKKFPNSLYFTEDQMTLFQLLLRSGKFDRMNDMALEIWNSSWSLPLLDLAEPFAFIATTKATDPEAIQAIYDRHRERIMGIPELVYAYAEKFEELGRLRLAADLYLHLQNLWPDRKLSEDATVRIASLELKMGNWQAAAFLFARAVEGTDNSSLAARALIEIAPLMEQGKILHFEVDHQKLSYSQVIDRIRYSDLDPKLRAPFSFRTAFLQALFGDTEKALTQMKNLQEEVPIGPFAGLYRDFYQDLLFSSVDVRYERRDFWAIDRLYQNHSQSLTYTTETQYPEKIALAYQRLDLPASALQIYEGLWNYKSSVRGFELAFEKPLTDYLLLLNLLRRDELLGYRLPEYGSIYTPSDRYYDFYRYVRCMYLSRIEEPKAFLALMQREPLRLNSRQDAEILRRMAVVAQESGDTTTANQVYRFARETAQTAQLHPLLLREAQLFDADYQFSLGNYFEAERQFRLILADSRFDTADRDWAYLQIARLGELQNQLLSSLRIYGQLAYSKGAASLAYSLYAKRRLASLAADKTIEEKERNLGAF